MKTLKNNKVMIIETHYNKICSECKSTPLKYDVLKQELYCSNCGLIHENNITPGNKKRFVKLPIIEDTFYFYAD